MNENTLTQPSTSGSLQEKELRIRARDMSVAVTYNTGRPVKSECEIDND